jgi:ATP-dependent RNA helicase RhlE
MPFSSLGLSPALVSAARSLGYIHPTPIQVQSIPAILRRADVQGQAQTGSGKTAAFALPLLQHLHKTQPPAGTRPVRALVLVPTRELAAQVGEVFRQLAKPLQHRLQRPLKVAVVFGGVSINPQMMALRGGADVVVATPGRLLDLLAHNALNLFAVQHLVLDEADRLLDLGFADELDQVLRQIPPQRQNLLFSATFSTSVQSLADTLLHNPLRIAVADAPADTSGIEEHVYQVDATKRTSLLRHLIQERGWSKLLVFVASQYAAEHVAHKLNNKGLYATAFHGGLSQTVRQEVLADFKAGRWNALVTTDLAARGIDIVGLPAVVNHDLPRSAVDYVHRIGRTGRAGKSGVAISFVSSAQLAHWHLIQKRQHSQLVLETIPGFEPTAPSAGAFLPPVSPNERTDNGNGGIKGKRPSKKDKLRAAALLAAAGTAPKP